jgi:site-specific DNA recombinase
VRNAAFDRVLITEPSRLARKYVHQMLLIEEFERAGCQIEFLDQPMSGNPHDQLLVQIRGAVAEYERSLIAERMRRGRLQKYRAGLLLRLFGTSFWLSRRSQPSTRPCRRAGGASRGSGGG